MQPSLKNVSTYIVMFLMALQGNICHADEYGPETLILPLFWDDSRLPTIVIYHSLHFANIISFCLFDNGELYWIDEHSVPSIQSEIENYPMLKYDGGPFKYATISSDLITSFIASLKNDSIFLNPGVSHPFRWDNSTFIYVNTPERRLQLISRHETIEKNGMWFLDSQREMLSTSGTTTETLLLTQPESYQRFRRVWPDVKNRILSLIPKDVQHQIVTGKTYRLRRVNALTQSIVLAPGEVDEPPPTMSEILWEIYLERSQ